ncbi:hypothetical protein [Kitasatospora kazusensis]
MLPDSFGAPLPAKLPIMLAGFGLVLTSGLLALPVIKEEVRRRT